MAVPLGLRKNFFNLGQSNSDDILNNDYCHKKLSTIKVKGVTKAGSQINFKRSWTKGSKWNYSDEIKIGHPITKSVYHQMRIDRKGIYKSHLELGDYKCLGGWRNLQACLKYDTNKQESWWRLSNSHKSANCESHQRIEVKPNCKIDLSLRTQFNLNKIQFNLGTIYSVSNNQLSKYDMSISRMLNEHVQLSLKHMSISSQAGIGKCVLAMSSQPNDSLKMALLGYVNKNKDKRRVVGGLSQSLGEHKVKVKLDHHGKISMAGVIKMASGLSMTLAGQFNPVNHKQGMPMDKVFPFGYTLDISL